MEISHSTNPQLIEKNQIIKYFPLLLFSILLIGLPAYGQQLSGNKKAFKPNNRPKLVIGIVVDQMRYDFLLQYWDKFGEDGFKRLVNEGFLFTNHHYNYFPTYTAPGHASIYTGATPSMHGIIGNSWYSRKIGDDLFCIADSTVETVGSSIDQKGSPVHLLTTTVTDELKKNLSQAKVISISIKGRSAILSGGHLADGAFWYDDDKTGDFITSSWYMNELPPWLKEFNEKNLSQKYSHQTWKSLLDLEDYIESNPDDSPYEIPFEGARKPTFPHHMAGSLERIRTSPFGNILLAELAKATVKGADLGGDKVPDFLAVSFSSTDYVGHRFGPNSIEVADTYLRLDRVLANLLKFLDKKVGKGNYLLFLTADHGAVEVPASLADRGLPGGYVNMGKIFGSLMEFIKNKYEKGQWVLEYENQQIYLNRKLARNKGVDIIQMQSDIAQFIRQFDGIVSTNTAHNFGTLKYSEGLAEMYQNGFYEKRSGDIYIQLKPGWIEGTSTKGTSHGSPYNYDTHVPLIFYGWHVPQGITSRKTVVTQIAPTLSNMLHLTFPSGSKASILKFK